MPIKMSGSLGAAAIAIETLAYHYKILLTILGLNMIELDKKMHLINDSSTRLSP
jgi:hypothetical protein